MASNPRFPLLCFIAFWSLCSLHSLLRRGVGDSDSTERKRLLDDVEGGLCKDEDNANGPPPKRRALLVGISYLHSPSSKWKRLDETHIDVEHLGRLLIKTYGYSPEDVVILKDDPELSDLFQPTRVNMLHELKWLVAGAAPGDKFTFLYTGHSDQQDSYTYSDEEDHLDEVIITSDLQRIVDYELNDILVQGLPVGCSLVAILDTYHSGTLLDLPHYYCNDIYVPWLSKGQRGTKTYHHRNRRRNALHFVDFPGAAFERPTPIVSGMNSQSHNDAPSGSPLRIVTEIDAISSMDLPKISAEADRQEVWSRSHTPLLSPTRQCASPVSMRCDGWCGNDLIPRATVLSISASASLQRAWDGPRGSLIAVLCGFLEKHPNPSYHKLMSHVNFQLYENYRAPREYTRAQKKKAGQGEGFGFDEELNDFQGPRLSSLSKLRMNDIFRL